MQAQLQSDGSLSLLDHEETRVIHRGHPAYARLLDLYQREGGIVERPTDDGRSLAVRLAASWNESEDDGRPVDPSEITEAATALAMGTWRIERTGRRWHAWPVYEVDDDGIALSGGVTDGEPVQPTPRESPDPGRFLAETYALLWNALEAKGQEPSHAQMEEAARELEDLGWVVEFDGMRWRARPAEHGIALSTAHAPVGGVTIAGKFFQGGRFIPSNELAKASPEVRAKVEQAAQEKADARRARGSVDTDALKAKLAPHAERPLSTSEEATARRTFAALKRHHGELVVHRLEEMAHGLHSALEGIPEDEQGQREQFGQRLKAVHRMLEMAHEAGHTGKLTPHEHSKAEYFHARAKGKPGEMVPANYVGQPASEQLVNQPPKPKRPTPITDGTNLIVRDKAKTQGLTEGDLLAHLGANVASIDDLTEEQGDRLRRDLSAKKVRPADHRSEPMPSAAHVTKESSPDESTAAKGESGQPKSESKPASSESSDRVSVNGDIYVRKGDRWETEDGQYKVSDSGMERWRKKGKVQPAPQEAKAAEAPPQPEPPAEKPAAPPVAEPKAAEPKPAKPEPALFGEPEKPAEKAAVSGEVVEMPVKDLHVDPERFQFKLNTDKSGVTDEMKQVKSWNPDFAGTLAVWKDHRDGRVYVVNGHHRREMAGRLGLDKLAVRFIKAADAKEARAVGALINIAEGRGTAIDAAKFMRDTGRNAADMEREGVSLKGKVAADAILLTRLNDRLFDRVARGTMDPTKAMAIAKHLDNEVLQNKLASLLDKREDEGKDYSPKVIEEMARAMAMAGTVTTSEPGLFGDIESEESTFESRAELAAHVRSELSKEANDWAAVASKRRAEVVGKAGNVLDTEQNARIAQQADEIKNVYATLVNLKGPIAESLNEAARELHTAKGKKAKDAIKQRALERVRDAVFREAGLNPDGSAVESGVQGGAPAPASGADAKPEAGDGGRNPVESGDVAPPADALVNSPAPRPEPVAPESPPVEQPTPVQAEEPVAESPPVSDQPAPAQPATAEKPPHHQTQAEFLAAQEAQEKSSQERGKHLLPTEEMPDRIGTDNEPAKVGPSAGSTPQAVKEPGMSEQSTPPAVPQQAPLSAEHQSVLDKIKGGEIVSAKAFRGAVKGPEQHATLKAIGQSLGIDLSDKGVGDAFRAVQEAAGAKVPTPEEMAQRAKDKDAQALAEQQQKAQAERDKKRVEDEAKRQKAEADHAAAMSKRVYMEVAYDDKEEAKAAGAKWDADKRQWYAPDQGIADAVKAAVAAKPRPVAPAAQPAAQPLNSAPSQGTAKSVASAKGKTHEQLADIAAKHGRTIKAGAKADSYQRALGHGKRAQIEKSGGLPKVGEIIQRKDGPHIVVSVGKPEFISDDFIEDMDAWHSYKDGAGWYGHYEAVPVERTENEHAEVAAADRKKQEEADAATAKKRAEDSAWAPVASYSAVSGKPVGLPKDLKWEKVYDDTGASKFGHGMRRYVATLPGGEKIGRVENSSYDDHRTNYYLPPRMADEYQLERAHHVNRDVARNQEIANSDDYWKKEAQSFLGAYERATPERRAQFDRTAASVKQMHAAPADQQFAEAQRHYRETGHVVPRNWLPDAARNEYDRQSYQLQEAKVPHDQHAEAIYSSRAEQAMEERRKERRAEWKDWYVANAEPVRQAIAKVLPPELVDAGMDYVRSQTAESQGAVPSEHMKNPEAWAADIKDGLESESNAFDAADLPALAAHGDKVRGEIEAKAKAEREAKRKARPKMHEVTGNTYPHKDRIKALGGRWRDGRWVIPADAASRLPRGLSSKEIGSDDDD